MPTRLQLVANSLAQSCHVQSVVVLLLFVTAGAASSKVSLLSVSAFVSRATEVEVGIPSSVSETLCAFVQAASASQLQLVRKLDSWPAPTNSTTAAGSLPTAATCALVSSSDALLDHAYGSEIDDAELVIRLNDAPLGGEHAEHVGEHEHIRLVNGGFGAKVLAGDMEINNDAVYVLMRPLQHQVEEAKRVLEAHPNARIVLGNEQLALACTLLLRTVFGHEPHGMLTTGCLGLGLALTLCDEVRAYGFANAAGSDQERQLWRKIALEQDVSKGDLFVIPGTRGLLCDIARPASPPKRLPAKGHLAPPHAGRNIRADEAAVADRRGGRELESGGRLFVPEGDTIK